MKFHNPLHATSRAKLPSRNDLRYLDLSGVGKAGDQGLEWKLLASCQCLEKLSLADCWGKMSDKTVQSIVKNGHSLRVLDLQNFDLSALSFTVYNLFLFFFNHPSIYFARPSLVPNANWIKSHFVK